MPDFQEYMDNPTDEQIIKEIEADNEKDYLKQLKKKNKDYLVKLNIMERERVARYICDRYRESIDDHKKLCDQIDEFDEVYRMVRKEVVGSDGNMPNYRSPLSAVTLEVVHANEMNVFFTPKDVMNCIPTEENDIPKVKKITTFGNWSMKNEMDLFTNVDRLFHFSNKVGECPYIVHWVREYGTEIKRIPLMNPANPEEPLIDPDTKKVLFQEVEEQKLLYNGPKLEVFSRKDYIQPRSATMDIQPEYEMRITRMTYDQYLREQLQGKMYAESIDDIKDWGNGNSADTNKIDFEGQTIPTGKWQKEFVEVYIRMRVNIVKDDAEDELFDVQELEDEFIAMVNIEDEVLCSLRKNKFPLKMRPVGVDYCIPDDSGRRKGLGIMEIMDGPQKAYDALFNQYILGTVQANSPVAFFTPMGNMRNEPMKIQNGFMYPTSDPSSVKLFQFPAPDQSIHLLLELINYWSQLLFGISDYAAGMESKIDPSAPAKKAEIVVAQGNVRLNMIIKRKNKTLQDIFKRWFLLYKENMPPNKFMRIAGSGEDPWKFENVSLQDFALNSIPDFELTGNILNSNKTLEAQKAIGIYQVLIENPLFMPQTRQGLQALHSLTKWLIDKMDETGLSRFLPEVPGEMVDTPEEENARFLQGDYGEPMSGEDHVSHIRVHQKMLADPNIPDDIKQSIVIPHIKKTVQVMQQDVTQQMVMQQVTQQPMQPMQPQPQMGGQNAFGQRGQNFPVRETPGMDQQQPAGMA